MAQPLATITTLDAVGTYAAESASVASSKCPAAVAAYQSAVALAQGYANELMTVGGDASTEAAYVDSVRQAILAANQVCRGNLAPTTTESATATVTDIQEDVEGGGGGGGGGGGYGSSGGFPWWLVGLLGVGGILLWRGMKKGKGSGGKKTRRVRRNRCRARRY